MLFFFLTLTLLPSGKMPVLAFNLLACTPVTSVGRPASVLAPCTTIVICALLCYAMIAAITVGGMILCILAFVGNVQSAPAILVLALRSDQSWRPISCTRQGQRASLHSAAP